MAQNKNLRYILIGLAIVLVGLLLWYFSSIIAYVLIAAVLSIILQPLATFFKKLKIGKAKFPPAIAALLSLAVFWGVVFLFFKFMIPLVAGEAQEISNIKPEQIRERLEEPLSEIACVLDNVGVEIPGGQDTGHFLASQLMTMFSFADMSQVFSSLTGILGSLFIAVFAITFIAFFFIKSEKMFIRSVLMFVPVEYGMEVKHAIMEIYRLLVRYFLGILMDILIVFVLVTVGMLIVGLEFRHCLVMGLIAGLLNVIPYVGFLFSMFFGLVIGLVLNIQADFYQEVLPLLGWMSIVYIAVNVIDGILVQPFIFSGSVKAHPLEIFLVILMAGTLAGIPGMILAIPGYTVLRVVAKEFFFHVEFVKKLTQNI
jgi:predicted PurR-regulated permease PerM